MLMVIFGAGASYDSFAAIQPPNANQSRPPLANQLFELRFGDFYKLFPQCHAIIPRLQSPDVNVEAVLESLQQDARTYPIGLAQLTAVRYYLQHMLYRCQLNWTQQITKGPTNYKTLLDQIARKPIGKDKVCLVTFNYDTLLDEAVQSRGNELRDINDYVRGDFDLVKIHGSINWAHRIRNPEFSDNTRAWIAEQMIPEIINKTPSLDINAKTFEIVHPDPFSRPQRNPLFPAVSIPVETKSGYECPEEHQIILKGFLPKVTKLLVIGWRAGEKQFLSTLVDGLKGNLSIMVVSKDEGSASLIATRIGSALRQARDLKVDNLVAAKTSFSNFVLSPEARDFLT